MSASRRSNPPVSLPAGEERSGGAEDGHWLPPEILSAIFRFLDDRDLASASGACPRWHRAAAWELRCRGKALYRWPHPPPAPSPVLWAVGERGLARALQLCKGIKTLEFSYDVPTKISSKIIRKAGEINLEKLSLHNIIFSSDNAKTLLTLNIPEVEIHTKRKKHLSRKSRKLLLENKELFRGLVFSSEQPEKSLHGIYVNPTTPTTCSALNHSRVFLEATGLTGIKLGDSLSSLRICNARHLTEREFLELSSLKLKHLAISESTVPEEVWSSCFQSGFGSLLSLSITNCRYLGLDAVRHISAKFLLTYLELDLRHLPRIDECIFLLQDSANLASLNLICECATEFYENMFLEIKWKKLKKILIRNNSFSDIKKNVLTNLIDLYKSHNILLIYHNNYTLVRTTLHLNKNLLS